MDANEVSGGFWATNEWRDKGDGEGCVMSLVRPIAVTAVLAALVVAAYKFGAPAIVDMWWS